MRILGTPRLMETPEQETLLHQQENNASKVNRSFPERSALYVYDSTYHAGQDEV